MQRENCSEFQDFSCTAAAALAPQAQGPPEQEILGPPVKLPLPADDLIRRHVTVPEVSGNRAAKF